MKNRNARVFAMFMSTMMAFSSVASLPVCAAEPTAEEAEVVTEEAEEVVEATEEAEEVEEATEEVAEETEEEAEEVEETEEVIEEAAEEVEEEEAVEEDEDIYTVANGTCGDPGISGVDSVKWELSNSGVLTLKASGTNAWMANYDEVTRPKWDAEKVTRVEVKGDLKNIGDYTFFGCENLESVDLKTTIEVIGESAFEGCSGLTTVTFDDPKRIGITVYETAAFKDCVSLEKMDFSQKVTEINDFTFYNCPKYVPGSMLEFPDTLEWIGVAAFWNCQSIKEVIIPYSVKEIRGGYDPVKYEDSDDATTDDDIDGKWGAFTGCTGLTHVELNTSKVLIGGVPTVKGIQHLGDFAFYGCSSLTDIVLPSTLSDNYSAGLGYYYDPADQRMGGVGDYAFADCTGMTEATIEDSDVKVIKGTFEECSNLTKVTFGTWHDEEYFFDIFGFEGPAGYWSYIQEIGDRSFNRCTSLTDVVLSKPLFNYGYWIGAHTDEAVIGEEAFQYCAKLTHFDFPDNTIDVQKSAFRECVRLNHVVLSQMTEHLGENAFYDDAAIEDFFIPAAMKQIDGECFDNVDGVRAMRMMDLYYGGTEAQWDALVPNIVATRTNNGYSNMLILGDSNAIYKATRYYEVDPELDRSDNVEVKYDNGHMSIKWDPVTMDGDITPNRYEVYQNNVKSSTIGEQWDNLTPSWTLVGRPTTNSLTFDIDNAKPGEVYNYRVLAVFGRERSYLTDYKEYKIPTGEEEIVIEKMEFSQAGYEVKIGQSSTAILNITPAEADFTDISFISSDSTIVGVAASPNKDGALIDGKRVGTATITAKTSEGVVATAKVTVLPEGARPVESIKINQGTVNVLVGGTKDISATVTPADFDATNFNWTSDNNQIAKVVATGDETTARITGVSQGSTTINVTSTNGTKASVTVTVSAQPDDTKRNYEDDPDATANGDGTYTVKDKDGVVLDDYTGMVDFDGEKFLMIDGEMATTKDHSGIQLDPVNSDVFWYLAYGMVQYGYDGLSFYDGEFFFVQDGQVDLGLSGFVNHDGETFFVSMGRMAQEANGLQMDPKTGKWYFCALGRVTQEYTGIAEYNGASFYVKNGELQNITGAVTVNGVVYNLVNGQVM